MATITILVVCCILTHITRGQAYFTSRFSNTSDKATSLCNLAEPEIRYRTDGQTVNVSLKTVSSPLWTGYVQRYIVMNYMGCDFFPGTVKWTNITNMTRPDPGHCYSFCKTKFVGIGFYRISASIQKHACFCIQTIPANLLLKSNCTKLCRGTPGVLCGDEWYVSLYKKAVSIFNTSIADNHISNNCLAYYSNGSYGYYFWSSCYNIFSGLCSNDVSIPNNTWADSINQCLVNEWFPMYLGGDLPRIPQSDMQIWIGTIRSYAIITKSDGHNYTNDRRGYIERDGPNVRLLFRDNFNSLHALCKGDETNSTCTTPQTPSNTNTTTTTSTTTSSSSDPGTTQTAEKSTSENGEKETVAIYVVIPIVILVAVAIIAFFVWRRRRAYSKNKYINSYIDTVPGNTNARSAVSNAAYQDDPVIRPKTTDELQHDCIVLEPKNDYAAMKISEHYDTAGEDYDTTVPVLNKRMDTGNVYNRLDDVSKDIYNHTDQADHLEDETYNHIGTGVADEMYGTASIPYDLKRQQHQTDNEYKDLTFGENTYSQPDVEILPTEHIFDDTYDHVEKGQVQTATVHTNQAHTPKRRPPTPEKPSKTYDYAFGKAVATNHSDKPVTPDKISQTYDYAYVKTGATSRSDKPVAFAVDLLPNAESYELAKSPMETANYELAKQQGIL